MYCPAVLSIVDRVGTSVFGGNSFQYLSTEQTRVRTKKRCTKNTLRVKLVPP